MKAGIWVTCCVHLSRCRDLSPVAGEKWLQVEGFEEALAGVFGEFGGGQGVVEVDGLAQGINNDAAVFAAGHVLLNLTANFVRGRAIHII
jgi:hypothetical protein